MGPGVTKAPHGGERQDRSELKERAPPPPMLYDSKLISEPVGKDRMDGRKMKAKGRMVG